MGETVTWVQDEDHGTEPKFMELGLGLELGWDW